MPIVYPPIPPIVSVGEEVAEAQQARDEGAVVVAPIPIEDTLDPGEFLFVADDDSGTNAPVREIENLQSLPASTADYSIPDPNELPAPGSLPPDAPGNNDDDGISATPTAEPGAAAGSDDSATANVRNTDPENSTGANDVTVLVNKTARKITPQPNILDRCSSYTYAVSIYLMSPEDYQRLMKTKKRVLAGYQLLMQSAGAPIRSGIVPMTDEALSVMSNGGVSLSQGRNQFFPLDYYIDDLELKSLVPGKGTGGAHNVVELKFKIIEPNGITLLDNLYKATRQYINSGGGASKTTKNGNYAAQNYLMVIRFYGYDENGNVLAGPRDTAGKSDANSLVEKFIPFQFTGIKFKVGSKLTEYDCSCVCPQNVIATGQGRGVIPYNIELSATTLQKLFSGNINLTTTAATQGQQTDANGRLNAANDPRSLSNTAPDKANNAPTTTLTSGLVQALNKYQAELVKDGTYGVPDKYNIVISHPELANASIVPPGSTDLTSKPMTQATSAAAAKDGEKQSVDKTAKTVSAIAGMSIVQFIDLAVRSSDYIYKQQNKIIDKNGKTIPQATSAQTFAWYRIGVEAKPIKNDPKRNDDAYEITYEIAPYGVNNMKSDYFPNGKFRGTQKKYAYWFTGENTSVINFEQDYNFTYYITVNSKAKPAAPKGTANYREMEKRLFSPNSPQSNQGIEGDINEPGANAADYLYSPSDQSRVKMTIVGDPSWIQQGEVWSGVRSTAKPNNDSVDVYFDAFLSDGTINFDAREALFELTWNKPADYDLESGLMWTPGQAPPTQAYIYKATQVTSNFRQGKFTQELEGVLLVFPDSIATTQAQTNAQTNTDGTETLPRDDPAQSGEQEQPEQSEESELMEDPEVENGDPDDIDSEDEYYDDAYDETELEELSPPEDGAQNDIVLADEEGYVEDYNNGIVREA